MIDLLKGGRTLAEVGNIYGLTRERVRQIVKRKGYKSNVFDIRGVVIFKYKCVNCNQAFYKKNRNKYLFCSNRCFGAMAKRNNNVKYKVTTIKTSDGISKSVYVHRLIMEKHLGRNLKTKEHVRHKDGNRLNNEIDNLEIIKAGEQAKIHNGWSKNLKSVYLGEEFVSKEKKNNLLHSNKKSCYC